MVDGMRLGGQLDADVGGQGRVDDTLILMCRVREGVGYTFSSRGMTAVHPCPGRPGGSLTQLTPRKESGWASVAAAVWGEGTPAAGGGWLQRHCCLTLAGGPRGTGMCPQECQPLATCKVKEGGTGHGERTQLFLLVSKQGEACKGRGRRYLSQTVGPLRFSPFPVRIPASF